MNCRSRYSACGFKQHAWAVQVKLTGVILQDEAVGEGGRTAQPVALLPVYERGKSAHDEFRVFPTSL